MTHIEEVESDDELPSLTPINGNAAVDVEAKLGATEGAAPLSGTQPEDRGCTDLNELDDDDDITLRAKHKSAEVKAACTNFDDLDLTDDDDMPDIVDNTPAPQTHQESHQEEKAQPKQQEQSQEQPIQQQVQSVKPTNFDDLDQLDEDLPDIIDVRLLSKSDMVSKDEAEVLSVPETQSGETKVSQTVEKDHDSEDGRLQRRLAVFRSRDDLTGESTILLQLSDLHLRSFRKKESLTFAQESRQAAVKAGDAELEAEAYRAEAKALLASERVTEAASLISGRVKSLAEEDAKSDEGGKKQIAAAILGLALADVELERGRGKEGQRQAEKALHACKDAGNKKWTAIAYEVQAAAYAAITDKMDKAMSSANKALDLYKELGDNSREAAILRTISRNHVAKGDAPSAVKAAQESQALCSELGDRRGEAAALECLATAHLSIPAGADEGVDAAMRAVKLYAQIHDVRGQISAWALAGNAHVAAREFNEAIRAAKEALTIARADGELHFISASMELLLNIHIQNETPDKAMSDAEEELELAREAGAVRRQASMLQKIASLHVAKNQPKEALRRAEEARAILKESGDIKMEAEACKTVADHLISQKRFDEAVETARESEALYRSLGDFMSRVQALQFITSAYCEKEDQAAAVKASWEQREVYKEAGYMDEEAATLLSIADFVNVAKGPKEAKKAAEDSRALFKQLLDKEGEAAALLAIANLQLAAQSPTDALKSTREAEALSRDLGDLLGQASALQTAANVYLIQAKHADAARSASEAKDLLQKLGDPRAEASAWQVVGQVHLNQCIRAIEAGRNAEQRVAKDALKAAETAVRLFREVEDLEGQASSMHMVANAHLYCGDPDNSLRAARESLEAAEGAGNASAVSSALAAMAQAYMGMENFNDGMSAAQEASRISQDAGDEHGFAAAQELIKALEESMKPKTFSRFGGRGGGRGPAGIGQSGGGPGVGGHGGGAGPGAGGPASRLDPFSGGASRGAPRPSAQFGRQEPARPDPASGPSGFVSRPMFPREPDEDAPPAQLPGRRRTAFGAFSQANDAASNQGQEHPSRRGPAQNPIFNRQSFPLNGNSGGRPGR